MDAFFNYMISVVKAVEGDTLPSFPDPGDPPDLGNPLTQGEIDFIKQLKKEIEERFISV